MTRSLSQWLGVELSPGLLQLALTHFSYAEEHPGTPSNERLEFVGDVVLGAIISELLYRSRPDLDVDQLTRLRLHLVNLRALGELAAGLGPHLLLGRRAEENGGREKAGILGDALVSLIGAVHLEHGPAAARTTVERLFGPALRALV